MGLKLGKTFSKLTKGAGKLGKLGKSFRSIRDNLTKKFPFLKKAAEKLSKSLTPEKLIKKLAPLLQKYGVKDPKIAATLNELLKGVKTPKDLDKVVRSLTDLLAQTPKADKVDPGFDIKRPVFRPAVPDARMNPGRIFGNIIELAANQQARMVA